MGCGSSTPAPGTSDDEVKELIENWAKGWFDGGAEALSTADCMFNPPGAPPMPIGQFLGMCAGTKSAFPNWTSVCHGAKRNKDGSYTILTQQCIGPMEADFPAMGPLPAVALSSVPEIMKQDLKLPVEVGTYRLSADGTKIASGTYAGKTKEVSGSGVTPEIAAIWNKKGDLSDVGFGALFKLMGVDLAPPPAAPAAMDMLMTGVVKDFDDWFQGFKTHASSKTFEMNGESYTVSLSRGECVDESKTDVLCDVADRNAFAAVFFSLDMGKMGPVMQEEPFKRMSEKAIVSQNPPNVLGDAPPPGAPPPEEKLDLFFTYEVEDVEKWVEGFLAHGSSKTGTWGAEAKYTRAEMCDEAKTRVFKSAYNTQRVGGMIYAADMAKMGEFMGDPSFAEVSKVLGIKRETMMMKTFKPAPPPP